MKLKTRIRTIDDLTPAELMQLDSARGLDRSCPPRFKNGFGLRPSLVEYNKAIEDKIYTGISIPLTQIEKIST